MDLYQPVEIRLVCQDSSLPIVIVTSRASHAGEIENETPKMGRLGSLGLVVDR